MLITMSYARFFCSLPLAPHTRVELPTELSHHAIRVLRLKDQSPIILFDGSGAQYPAILEIDGKRSFAQLGAAQTVCRELKGKITLAQGLASSDKMDWVIEKAVELGLHEVVPIRARKSVLQLNPERQAKRLTHWQGIIQAASEQCGRNRLMQLAQPCTLEAYLRTPPKGLLLFCDPGATLQLKDLLTPQHEDIILLVGPEGGWTEDEQQTALKAGAQAICFGHRVLRTETAGLALSAAISALQAWE